MFHHAVTARPILIAVALSCGLNVLMFSAAKAADVEILPAKTPAQDRSGVYVVDGSYGTGWHHFNTTGDQTFAHHPGQHHLFVFDFGVPEMGKAAHIGHDIIATFDANLDKICFSNTQAGDGYYAVSSSVVSGGVPGGNGGAVTVTSFTMDAAMNFTDLGTLTIDRWVSEKGNRVRGSHRFKRFLPVQGCR